MLLLNWAVETGKQIQSTNPNNFGKIEQWFRGMTTGSKNIDFDDMTENKNMQFTQVFVSHYLFFWSPWNWHSTNWILKVGWWFP